MGDTGKGDVTQLLELWGKGDTGARDAMAGIVHGELRRLADSYLRRERSGHTLQPTALVSEVWMRLVRQSEPNFENRRRFFALAAQIMRQILVDHARAAKSAKRGAGMAPVTLQEGAVLQPHSVEEFLILDEALDKLASVQPRMAKIIELRYFAGLSVVETGEVLDVSIATVSREQKLAEAMLSRFLSETGA